MSPLYRSSVRERFLVPKISCLIPVVCNLKKCPLQNTNLSEKQQIILEKKKISNWFSADNVEIWHCHNAIGWLSKLQNTGNKNITADFMSCLPYDVSSNIRWHTALNV